MYNRLSRRRRIIPAALGLVTLISAAVLLATDINPKLLPGRAHDILATFSLTTIAIAYLLYQCAHRPVAKEFAKAILLAVAFLFWAANQLWPDSAQATLFNDIAITLFVLDVFLVIVGWPKGSPDESFAETRLEGQ
jgi:peptidoglycan/LPS O-acetylase OafA/YrhL